VVNLKGEPCALVIGRDITGRKRAEELLRASEERFRSYFELGLIGIAITLPTKGWVEVNDELLKILGYERRELFEKTWAELTHPDDLAADDAKFNRILRGEIDGYSMDKRFIRKDGKVVDTTISTKCVRRSDGSIDYLVGLLQDITERKQAENQLKVSREQLRNLTDRLHHAREEESTRIARELHDELGQALTAIIIDLSWLEEKWFDDEGDSGRQELLEKIRSATKLARSTTNTVRRIATELRPGLLDDFGIAAAIEWQAQEFQQRTGIRCEVDAHLTHADLPAQLSTAVFRIFQEALTNVARHARASSVRVSLKDAGGCVCLEVKDDGRGVAEAELADARALGVAGIRERALLLGGEARIEGSPGEGTTVSVRIPLRPPRRTGRRQASR
ncbi:MAG TPA: PAS domain S-box protein, partial [Bradyrhizobium sp.]|nr:PAS domain S-box protein [Bradyrhizobium sp.]